MNTPVPALGVLEASEIVRSGATLIDVREPNEFEEVRAIGAKLVPLNQVPDHISEWSAHRFVEQGAVEASNPLYVICRSGARSHAACEWLISQGIDAVNVVGGTLAWVAADLDVEHGDSGR
jgi:rhodanese-related sulfurtransferase